MRNDHDIKNSPSVLTSLGQLKVVPVVVLDRQEDAAPLGEALVRGGLPIAEVTFRTDAAAASMKILADRGDILVGAGTVTTPEQVDIALDNGAQFIVSPGFHEKVVQRCLERNICILPGIASASDIARAMDHDLPAVKFFPAEANGGVKLLKALAAPYHKMKFVPTGGIHAGNINDYLAISSVLACGGSWMVDRKLVNEGDFESISRLTTEATQLVNV